MQRDERKYKFIVEEIEKELSFYNNFIICVKKITFD